MAGVMKQVWFQFYFNFRFVNPLDHGNTFPLMFWKIVDATQLPPPPLVTATPLSKLHRA